MFRNSFAALVSGSCGLWAMTRVRPGRFFLDIQGEEFTIVGYAVVRDKGDAETDAGKINQEVVTAQFDFRDQIQLVLLEEVVQEFAGGAFPVEHHDRVVQEIFQVQFFIHQFFVVG